MYENLRRYISVLLFAILILSGCNPLPNPFASNPFISSPEIDQVIKSGSFVEDTELQYFPIFNCQSQVQNTVNVSRSRTLEQSVNVSIDPNIKFASPDKLSNFIDQVDVTIGGNYGWTNGTTVIDSSGLTLNAAPQSYPVYTIAWRQRWEKGYVVVKAQNGTEQLPYQFLSEAHPEIQNINNYDCTASGFSAATAMALSLNNNSTPTPTLSPTKVPAPTSTQFVSQPAISEWTLGNLIYEETFENGAANGFHIRWGDFNIVQTSDGNHVWRTSDISSDADAQLVLPTQSSDYAVEAKIMQVSGEKGFAFINIRYVAGSPCNPDYELYMDTFGGWLNLIERSSTCEELRQTGLFANYHTSLTNGVWYTLKMEAKGPEIRAYLDGNLVMRAIEPGVVLKSNVIGVSTCCGDTLPHTFDFDDIRVWLINP
ncbi:MAG: hypothetical protein M1282_17030 [Chloroflexi bacterium]|nr:hypothetical protein [Chloroflexota bacterium]